MQKYSEQFQKECQEKLDKFHKPPDQILIGLEKDVDDRQSTPKYPFGISEIDELIWGLHKKELLVIGARPSHGKTSLAMCGFWNLVKLKIPSIFVSLEMSRENIIERIMCQEYKICGWKLRKGMTEEKEKFFKSLPDLHERMKAYPMQIFDFMGRTVEEIRFLLEEFKPDTLWIDHVQKISPKGYANKYEALAHYTNTLQDLAIEYDCAVVLNSQINRNDMLKGAGDLEECADTFIQCKWMFKEASDNGKSYSDRNEFEVCVMKQRHGACDHRLINFFPEYYSFESKGVAWTPK